ncbi:MAG: TIGR00266 family protein [Anaerolineae bacterium]|nr:TIGR00266 family protein [Thermoflexales bacterium]MDW8395978.1 TIGR00266 family protein [Anaerolineae bacterium]
MTESYTNLPGQRLDTPNPEVTISGQTMGGAEYRILGTTLQAAILKLRAGQTIFTETGSLSWMQEGINMNTTMGGGLGGLLKRVVSGESLFIVDYTAQRDGVEIAFSNDFPGKIIPINLGQGQQIIAQKRTFLVGEKSVSLDIHFNRRLGAGLFGGEGFILQKFTGPGTIFVTVDGEVVEYTLAPGERLKVDTGHVAMFESTVQFDIEFVKGIKNILFGGEGLFFAVLTGPGRIWLQTMPMSKLAGAIAAYLPSAEGKQQGFNINLGG